jgi:uncharacterized protein (UPF0147 family)
MTTAETLLAYLSANDVLITNRLASDIIALLEEIEDDPALANISGIIKELVKRLKREMEGYKEMRRGLVNDREAQRNAKRSHTMNLAEIKEEENHD